MPCANIASVTKSVWTRPLGLGLLDNFCSFKSWDGEVFAGQQAAKGYDGVMGHLSISIDFHMIHRYS